MLWKMDGQQEALAQIYVHDHTRAALLIEEQALAAQLHEVELASLLADKRRALARQLKDQRERASDLAWELEETERRLASLLAEGAEQGDILGAREVIALRKQKMTLEDDVLQHMEQIEGVVQDQVAAEADWLHHASRWAEQAGSVRAAAAQLAYQLVALNADRDTWLAALNSVNHANYVAAAAHHPLTPIARVEQGQCEGCRTSLLPALLAALPAVCPTCARILLPSV